ncbi:hypothetical protein TCON_0740 [Astathelohania contejeani]|uniref:Uncharacterized protein n=1 Tax=Astathelohania contejeani TaxID=164912 RepID=A0ABQ7I0V5_9MICR|nr:hypothetical protein TCON_0740 [Thelohania contejeani]
MIKLYKENVLEHTIKLDYIDPISFEPYSELVASHRNEKKDFILCMLQCKGISPVYPANFINRLRYGETHKNVLQRYTIVDPMTRILVDDLWYFIAKRKDNYEIAKFVCNEEELINYKEYQDLIFENNYEENEDAEICTFLFSVFLTIFSVLFLYLAIYIILLILFA